jgi:general secretion pathway protein B
MSILLEALRKSEKNQQAHEVPTIHGEDLSGQDSEPLKFLPMASMLIVALVVSGWFVWRQYEAPEGSYQPPVALSPESSAIVATPGKEGDDQASGQAVGAGNAGASKPVNQPVDKSTNATTGAPDKAVPTARTPVESFKKPQTVTDQPPAPKPKTSAPSKPVTAAPEKAKPSQPEPISYWELPDAVRASVPEIKFSVLVYSSKPSDRFVLINGQRLREGDSLPSGPEVAEIRRDGVVFTHRLYRFLVER